VGCDRGKAVTPQFIRAVLSILVVRAIFISPALGSEFGPSSRLGDSSLKRMEAIRPTRLRFTKPCPPSASQERLDCLEGGDGDDDERTPPAETSVEAWSIAVSARPTLLARLSIGAFACASVRLRC
jgi:hypothetical protein